MTRIITDAQAETIYDIHSGWGIDGDFMPIEVFPSRNNADNAKRRVCRTLEKKQLIERVYIQPYDDRPHFIEGRTHYRLRLTQDALDEFERYAIKYDYQFPW